MKHRRKGSRLILNFELGMSLVVPGYLTTKHLSKTITQRLFSMCRRRINKERATLQFEKTLI